MGQKYKEMGNIKERLRYRVGTTRCFTTYCQSAGREREKQWGTIFDKIASEHFPGLILKITNHRIRKPSESHIG